MNIAAVGCDAVICSGCGTPVPVLPQVGVKQLLCNGCGTPLQVEIFPAFFRGTRRSGTGELISSDEEASCFYHGNKRAAALCEVCGRFLCSLCEVRIGARVLCPACIDKGKEDGSVVTLVNRRTLYDSMALSISLGPLLFCYVVTVITAPLAIFLAVRSWKTPGSILPRTKARSILAILLASLQLAGWITLVVYLVSHAE